MRNYIIKRIFLLFPLSVKQEKFPLNPVPESFRGLGGCYSSFSKGVRGCGVLVQAARKKQAEELSMVSPEFCPSRLQP